MQSAPKDNTTCKPETFSVQEAADDMKTCMETNAGGTTDKKATSGNKAADEGTRTPRVRKARRRNETPKKPVVTPRKLFQESGEEESHLSTSPVRMLADRSPEVVENPDDSGDDGDVFGGRFALQDVPRDVETPTRSKSKRKRSKKSSPKKKKVPEQKVRQEITPAQPDLILSPQLLALIPAGFNKTLICTWLCHETHALENMDFQISYLRCDTVYLREIFVAEDITTVEDAADVFTVAAGHVPQQFCARNPVIY